MSAGSFWQRLRHGVWRAWSDAAWMRCAALNDHAFVMSMPVTDRRHAKQGRSTGRVIWKTGHGTLRFYLKRHVELAWWRGCIATLWPGGDWSPAAREARHLDWARQQGLAVPRTLACGERIGPWGRIQSYLAVEELTGFEAVNELLPRARAELGSGFRDWKKELVLRLATIVRRLHGARLFHKDLYLCHFFVQPQGSETYLIDLHRLRRHPWTGWRWRVKDLAQLAYSAGLDGIDDRDRLRFFHAYLGKRKLDWADRQLLRAVMRKANRYRTHNVKRQATQPAGLRPAARQTLTRRAS